MTDEREEGHDEAILGTADELAERWAEKPAIRRMAQACASVFSEWASDDIISRFHDQMIALMKQSFVEGAFHCRAHPTPEQGWRADRRQELHAFLDALSEWGCDDPAEMASEIITFLKSEVGLDAYRLPAPPQPEQGAE